MGFREPIDMGEFIQTSEYLSGLFDVPPELIVPKPRAHELPGLMPDEERYSSPMKAEFGRVATRSTSLALEIWPSVVWDVNGYYCALGVGFRASRKQLMQAYNTRNGQGDDYLTYVFSQLLDPEVRCEYDACPLGTKFFDRYVQEELRRRAIKEARRMQAMGLSKTVEDILEEWGFEFEEDPGQASDEDGIPQESGELDTPKETGEDKIVPPVTGTEPWPYTYYLWRMKRREERSDDAQIMRRWQEAIVAECQSRRITANFGVGLMGKDQGSRTAKMSVSGVNVIFIAANVIDDMEDLARTAVNLLTPKRF